MSPSLRRPSGLKSRAIVRVVTWALLMLVLGACASNKEYVASEDPDTQECITACGTVRTQCRARAQDLYQQCRQNFEFQQRAYDNCRRTGNKACMVPPRCPPPETRYCTNQYDGCFQSCGGQIVEPE